MKREEGMQVICRQLSVLYQGEKVPRDAHTMSCAVNRDHNILLVCCELEELCNDRGRPLQRDRLPVQLRLGLHDEAEGNWL